MKRAPPLATGRRTVLLFSDLYEAEPAARALAVLRRRTATVVCAHVIAQDELHAPVEPALLLRDAETDETLHVELTASARQRFAREADAFLQERVSLAASHGSRLVRVAPGDDLIGVVEHIVAGDHR